VTDIFEREFAAGSAVTSGDISAFGARLRSLGTGADDPVELIEQLRELEALKSATAAAQARVTAAFAAANQRAAQKAAGVAASKVGTGIAAQVAFATGQSQPGQSAPGSGRGADPRAAEHHGRLGSGRDQ